MDAITDIEVLPAKDFLTSPAQLKIDALRQACATLPQIPCPVVDRFTPGLYTREIFMPADTFIISKIHLTEHPYVVLKGSANVWIEGAGVQSIQAPFVGITKPNTRRVLYVTEDCVWLTFHPTNKTTVDEVEQDIILKPNDSAIMDLNPSIVEQLKQGEI